MFDLIQQLNEQLAEALERRVPIVKVTSTDAPTTMVIKPMTTVIDVQHLTDKDVVGQSIRLIKQILSQYKTSFNFNFETNESGLFNNLILSAESDGNPTKYLQFDFNELTSDDIAGIKKRIGSIGT
jgi:hypothetical protein